MLSFSSMHLEVFRNGGRRVYDRVAIHARRTREEEEAESGLPWAEKEKLRDERGLGYLSFYMSAEEFYGLMSGKVESVSDGYHGVRAMGEQFTFFDMNFRPGRGVLRVPFVNVSIPRHVGRILTRAVKMTLKKCEPDSERKQLQLSRELRERWLRQYGQGKGRAFVDVEERALAQFDSAVRNGGETFKRQIDNLRNIARNSTWRASESAVVKISSDGPGGFYWRAFTPQGRIIMNGGVINHGRDGAHDWSTHT